MRRGLMGGGFEILERLITLTGMRHGVIASNIANVDTPDYRARDIRFGELLDSAMVELTTTNPKHLKGGNPGSSSEALVETTQPWADGNNVEIDMEVAKMVENAVLLQAGINMLSTRIRMFKSALRRQ